MVIFEGREYQKIRKFDCIVLNFQNTEGPGYFTVLPISPKEYREEQTKAGRTTKAKVEIIEYLHFVKFEITDDRGEIHRVTISKDMKKEITAAKDSAKQKGLLC